MRGAGSGNGLARQYGRGRDRIPHHEAGDDHNDRAPDHCKILDFLAEVIARQMRMLANDTQIEAYPLEDITNITRSR